MDCLRVFPVHVCIFNDCKDVIQHESKFGQKKKNKFSTRTLRRLLSLSILISLVLVLEYM